MSRMLRTSFGSSSQMGVRRRICSSFFPIVLGISAWVGNTACALHAPKSGQGSGSEHPGNAPGFRPQETVTVVEEAPEPGEYSSELVGETLDGDVPLLDGEVFRFSEHRGRHMIMDVGLVGSEALAQVRAELVSWMQESGESSKVQADEWLVLSLGLDMNPDLPDGGWPANKQRTPSLHSRVFRGGDPMGACAARLGIDHAPVLLWIDDKGQVEKTMAVGENVEALLAELRSDLVRAGVLGNSSNSERSRKD